MIQRGQWDAFLKGTNAYYNEHHKEVIPPPEVPHEKTTLQVDGMNKTFVNWLLEKSCSVTAMVLTGQTVL